MKTITDITTLKNMTVFMRTDIDVPVASDGTIGEAFRIMRQRETIHHLIDGGARVVLAGHISAIPSVDPIRAQLAQLWGVTFGDQVTLLENTRTNPGEMANDAEFAKTLVAGCDLYVNNAFAVCHRAHASVVAAAQLLPAYAGLVVAQEVQQLTNVMSAPAEGKVVFMGGAKASTKVPVITSLIGKAQTIAVGGVIANDVLKERGYDVGTSVVDADAHTLLAGVDVNDARLAMPDDFVQDGTALLDVGPRSAARFAELAMGAKVIIWNGPMGRFEDPRYIGATKTLADAIASSSATTVIGGGDTVAALNVLGIGLERFGFVSTGGGAMLAFLAGEQLPGLVALGYDARHA